MIRLRSPSIYTTSRSITSFAELSENNLQRVQLLLLGGIYLLLFVANYYWFISPIYSYSGMITRSMPLVFWLLIGALSLLPLLWLPTTCKLPSDYTSWILYITVVGPFPIIAALTSRSESLESVWTIEIWLIIAFFVFDLCRRFQFLPIINLPTIKSLMWVWLPGTTLALSLLVLVLNNFQVDFSLDVYERRLAAREVVVTGSLNSYAVALLRGTCAPIMLAIGLYYRRYLHLILSLFAVLIIFGFDGTKSSVFTPILITFVIWLIVKYKYNHSRILLLGLIALCILALVEGVIVGNSVISYMIIRRILCLPSLLTTYYWDFFSNNPFVLFSDNLLRGFITPRYDLAIPRVIGEVYYGRAEANANANLWASGYAHLGIIGVLLTSIVGGLLLSIIDSISKNSKFVLGSVICVVIGLSWSQGALHTSILSSGVLSSVIVLLFFPNPDLNVEYSSLRNTKSLFEN